MAKVRIPSTGQIYLVETDLELKPGQKVLVAVEDIQEIAIAICDKNCPKNAVSEDDKGTDAKAAFLRILTEEDLAFKKELDQKAEEYLPEAEAKTIRHGLDLKLISAELSFDEKKLTFYFSADGRVDFRSLVADMVGSFRKIIRLQQIGPRDEAKKYGGFGKCGRELCCATFLPNLESVTLEMANLQEMAGGRTAKITGCCGKLMCCLSYEADDYKTIKSKMPKIGSNFKSSQGEGKVIEQNVLENKVILETAEGKRIEVLV